MLFEIIELFEIFFIKCNEMSIVFRRVSAQSCKVIAVKHPVDAKKLLQCSYVFLDELLIIW
jgi:hypothetical protein